MLICRSTNSLMVQHLHVAKNTALQKHTHPIYMNKHTHYVKNTARSLCPCETTASLKETQQGRTVVFLTDANISKYKRNVTPCT